MHFEVIGPIEHIERGRRWRKLKGHAVVRLDDGRIRRAESHWYEARGIGRKGLKISRLFPDG